MRPHGDDNEGDSGPGQNARESEKHGRQIAQFARWTEKDHRNNEAKLQAKVSVFRIDHADVVRREQRKEQEQDDQSEMRGVNKNDQGEGAIDRSNDRGQAS